MATRSTDEKSLVGRIAAAGRWAKDDPDASQKLAEDRAELATIRIEKYVHSVLSEAPPLSTEQLGRLRVLLDTTAS